MATRGTRGSSVARCLRPCSNRKKCSSPPTIQKYDMKNG
ncbi:Uncharacterised protein [Bordetella pertussis]|nr:Uncharacterised protein [Bordetella pertussis]CFU83520.1 Uncharacterised protein [Bordetella pertussis]CFW32786.1 Uncharacterised protein [Bordetella pertussis]CPN29645.1 Uncharacterised protein [Bordetella pertussis]